MGRLIYVDRKKKSPRISAMENVKMKPLAEG